MTSATAITLDRELVERFIVEVHGLATFNSIIQAEDTWLEERAHRVAQDFQTAALENASANELAGLRKRGVERGIELADELWREQ